MPLDVTAAVKFHEMSWNIVFFGSGNVAQPASAKTVVFEYIAGL